MIGTRTNTSDETFQDGTAPVQAFTSPAVRPTSGAELTPRLGRPPRVASVRPRDSKNSAVPLPTEAAMDEPVESLNQAGASR